MPSKYEISILKRLYGLRSGEIIFHRYFPKAKRWHLFTGMGPDERVLTRASLAFQGEGCVGIGDCSWDFWGRRKCTCSLGPRKLYWKIAYLDPSFNLRVASISGQRSYRDLIHFGGERLFLGIKPRRL
jgi:hypothetical protein